MLADEKLHGCSSTESSVKWRKEMNLKLVKVEISVLSVSSEWQWSFSTSINTEWSWSESTKKV